MPPQPKPPKLSADPWASPQLQPLAATLRAIQAAAQAPKTSAPRPGA